MAAEELDMELIAALITRTRSDTEEREDGRRVRMRVRFGFVQLSKTVTDGLLKVEEVLNNCVKSCEWKWGKICKVTKKVES